MKWFTPTIKDSYENIWSRKDEPAPYSDCDAAIRQFIEGNKPVVSVVPYLLKTDEMLSSTMHKYRHKSMYYSFQCDAKRHVNAWSEDIIFYKSGAFQRAARIVDMFQSREELGLNRSARWHCEIGWLYGYPIKEIEAFIQRGLDEGDYHE